MDDALTMFDAFNGPPGANLHAAEGHGDGPGFIGSGGLELASSVQLEKVYTGHNCTHHRLSPSGYVATRNQVEKPAKEYPFKLDEFQQRSIDCLENNESVLVCAHTSAGKTAVAEYAIAMGLRDKRRIIYTSPIKALSNQKYRNLADEFVDVGLMTGDVTLNQNASVMVMTTEILRSMLYRGSDIIQEMKWVIFDEVHYMRDPERGVVWEETIILIPQNVHLVFLSATIPNYLEFAEWVCRIKNTPCNVITTDYRPTPLQHYVYPSSSAGIFLVLDENNKFRQDAFVTAMSLLETPEAFSEKNKKKRGSNNDTQQVEALVSMCHANNFTPVIVFSFSKATCELNATAVRNLDMTDTSEKALIEEIYRNAMATLGDEDRKLPQAVSMLPLLKRGIGIHHGGLLPIIKEIVEILFQEGLVKVLFSTETFSMGVNMPAKCVVFTKLSKWDGANVRRITCGEYIQMAGRAGRRGLDEHGLVIIMLKEGIKPEEAKAIFLGRSNPLQSSFHLGYNMLLNLMRIEDTTPEFLIERSFLQFQRDTEATRIQEELEALNKQVANARLKVPEDKFADLDTIYKYKTEKRDLKRQLGQLVTTSEKILNFLNFGRCVRIVDVTGGSFNGAGGARDNGVDGDENGGACDWGWGICFGCAKVRLDSGNKRHKCYIVDCLVACDPESVQPSKSDSGGLTTNLTARPMLNLEAATLEIVPFSLDCIYEITQIKMNMDENFRSSSQVCQAKTKAKLQQLHHYMNSLPQVPLLDPIEHMQIETPQVKALVQKIAKLQDRLQQQPIISSADFSENYASFLEYIKLVKRQEKLKSDIEQRRQIVMRDELKKMKAVLKALGYVDSKGIVTIKGRVACDINATDELLVAEMFLRNFFDGMNPEYICASLSCLVIDENKNDTKLPTDVKLLESYTRIREIANEIAQVMVEHQLDINPAEMVNRFKPTLMTIVLRWARGDSFNEILADSNVFEGSVIRCVRRLDELLRQLACTCRNIGNVEMEAVFVECIQKLHKGIIFTSSLYL